MSNYGYQQPPAGYTYDEYGRLIPMERRPPPRDPYPPSAPPSGPNYRWWIPAEGIRRDVIQADIQRYLGPDAVVRPGEGRDEDRGRDGYWIAAYRTFTAEMIRDLKADSANFERSGDRGAYQDSMIHRSRQHWGPTQPQAAEPADRQPSRASDSTTYSGGTSNSYASTGYSSGSYAATNPGYPTSSSSSQPGGTHYTYQPQAESSTSSHYSYQAPETGYSHSRPEHESQPRTRPTNPTGYPSSTASQQSYNSRQSTQHSASAAAPPGYYLASDGNYYPNASRPTP